MVWPAIIAAGAGLLAGKLSQDAADDRADEANRRAEEMAKSGIRWRVEDAKAAGLHPLYALGGAGATYSPAVAPVFDQSQNVGRAAEALSSGFEKAMRDNTLAMSASQLEESDLRKDLLYTQIWRNILEASPSVETMPAAYRPGTVHTQEGSMPGGFAGLEPFTSGSPREQRAGTGSSRMIAGQGGVGPHDFGFDKAKVGTAREFDPAYSAGPARPFFEEYRIGSRPYHASEGEHGRDRGLYLALPAGGSASEAAEAISEGGGRSPIAGLIYAENVRRYGQDYVNALRDYLRGGAASPSLGSQLSGAVGSFFAEWRRRKQANRR